MMLVLLAVVLWLGFNFAVVFADLALIVREERAVRRERDAAPIPLRHGLHLHH